MTVNGEDIDKLAREFERCRQILLALGDEGSHAVSAGPRRGREDRRQRNMTELDAIWERHSVRQYLDQSLRPEEIAELREEVRTCNRESGLHIQLITNEPKAFNGFMAHYGKFGGVTNYFALVGKAGPDLQEKCGYWGERLVLKAQMMGLNTCWVALTFSKVKSAYGDESAEVPVHTGWRPSVRPSYRRILFQNRFGHRQVPF